MKRKKDGVGRVKDSFTFRAFLSVPSPSPSLFAPATQATSVGNKLLT